MSSEPTRTLRQYGDDKKHRKQEDALQNDRNAPGIALSMGGESIVDPIDKIGAEVQSRKLHADVQAPVCFGGEFRLEDRDGGIDEAHAAPGDDSGDDDMRTRVGCGLQ